MKKKILLTTLSFFALFISCIKDYQTYTSFEIKNGTGRQVTLMIPRFEYNQSLPLKDTIIVLASNKGIEQLYYDDGKNASWKYPLGFGTDSVYILFTEQDTVKYAYTDNSVRNPLRIENYAGGRKSDVSYKYIFIITEQDYLDGVKE